MSTKDNQQDEFVIDVTTLKPYFLGKRKHINYYKALDHYFHMDFHFNGYFLKPETRMELADNIPGTKQPNDASVYFARLIDLRRPSESDAIMTYRRVIYTPKTKVPCFKVYNSLRKIIKASDWKIDYSEVTKPAGIADGEYLEDYCEKNFPRFNSVENWLYNYGMKNMLVDANALIFVLPKTFDMASEMEYYEPVITIIPSKHVLDYRENEYCVFMCEQQWEYVNGSGMKKMGKRMGIITKQGYWEARQRNDKQQFDIVQVGAFEMEYMPAWIIGGVPVEVKKESILYDSFLAPMLPALDDMAREFSDSQAEMVQHIFSTMWYFTQQDCNHCMGKGKMQGKGKQLITCSECNGTGNSPKSPYRDMVLNTNTFDGATMPTPPAGYVQKDTGIVKLMAERLEDHEYHALSSVNHEFLAESPATTSGVSKQYDRQELENFTYGVAYHLVEFVMKDIYYFINEFRYNQRITNQKVLEEMLPKISIPQNYDLLTTSIIEQQFKTAKDGNLDPAIINAMEQEYVLKKFPNDIELREKISIIKEIDPFPGKTQDEKQNMILTKTALLEDVVLSNYIYPFVERAIEEDEGFCEKPYADKIKILYAFVDEKIKLMDKANKLNATQPPNGVQADPKRPGFDMQGNPIKNQPPIK